MPTEEHEILARNQQLLDCIAAADWATYETLCDPTLTCFEPEARGQQVEGLGFHRYYFDLGPSRAPVRNTMASARVRMIGDQGAVVTYLRLTQRLDPEGRLVTAACEETRVWQKQAGAWRHVHFHRSLPG